MESSSNNSSSPSIHRYSTRYKHQRNRIDYNEDSDPLDNDLIDCSLNLVE